MEPFFTNVLTLFLQILFLLGASMVAIWFYFRMKAARQPALVIPGKEDSSVALSIRLQACERLILFLERVSFNQLIPRLHAGQMTVVWLEQILVKTVREEYDYNLSQQLYVTPSTWEKIRHAREDTIRIIHAHASRLLPEDNATTLASLLVKETVASGKNPVQEAIDAIKQEVQSGYGF